MNIYKWYKIEHILYKKRIPILPNLIKGSIRILWGCVLPFQVEVGEGTLFGYQGLGIVLNKNTRIGKNCTICQNVTIGNGGAIIGDNVMIGAGTVILGNIHIGNNVDIGANAVVLSDIPDNSVAVGVPAKVVKLKRQIPCCDSL